MALDDNFKDIYSRDELLKLGIYDLRKLGQDVGVVSPTALKKEELVDKIIAVIYGEAPTRKIGKGRGRPPKDNNKPCKLYLDLIEKIEEPNVETEFVYVDRIPELEDVQKVASPRIEYMVSDGDDDANTLKRGVVCDEGDKVFVRKLRQIQTDNDYILPREIYDAYGLRDYDLIEFLLGSDKKTVDLIVKVNGRLASRIGDNLRREAPKTIKFGSDMEIRTNESTIVEALTVKERGEMNKLIASRFAKLGYRVVSVNFDRFELDNEDDKNDKISRLFCVGARDEYETMAVIENAIERVKTLAMLEDKCVLLVGNFGWLLSVVETFPKYLYGNFVAKLAKLSSDRFLNITVVCIMSDMTDDDKRHLCSIFDNLNLSQR